MISWRRLVRRYKVVPPSLNSLRLIAKMLAVHKNGRFYGRGLQKSTAVHENGCFYGWDVEKHRFCPKIDQSAVQMCCNRFRAKRGRISAASSASARLSEKVEAAGTPDWSVSGRRHAPDRGCHEVTGVKKQVQAKKTQHCAESFLLVPGAGVWNSSLYNGRGIAPDC